MLKHNIFLGDTNGNVVVEIHSWGEIIVVHEHTFWT